MGHLKPVDKCRHAWNPTHHLLSACLSPSLPRCHAAPLSTTSLSFESKLLIRTSHITPQQAGGIFAAAQPRLAVAHHLTVNAASRAAIIQDIRQGYPKVRRFGLAGLAVWLLGWLLVRGERACMLMLLLLTLTLRCNTHVQGGLIINEDLNVYDISHERVEVRRELCAAHARRTCGGCLATKRHTWPVH
jgi:hypothetical protein